MLAELTEPVPHGVDELDTEDWVRPCPSVGDADDNDDDGGAGGGPTEVTA